MKTKLAYWLMAAAVSGLIWIVLALAAHAIVKHLSAEVIEPAIRCAAQPQCRVWVI